LEQLLSTYLVAVGCSDLHCEDTCAALLQGRRDLEEIGIAEDLIEAEQAVHQHDGILGLGEALCAGAVC
jgi:hypothetical protein